MPAAREFVLNILSNGYTLVVQAMNWLDNRTGGRLSQAQSRVSAVWDGFTQFMVNAWTQLTSWANSSNAQNNAIAQDFVELNRRQTAAASGERAPSQPAHTSTQGSSQEVLRPAPPPPRERSEPGGEDHGMLADDEESDRLHFPELDAAEPMDAIPELCEGMGILNELAERLEAVGRTQSPDPEDPRPEGQTEVASPEDVHQEGSDVLEVWFIFF